MAFTKTVAGLQQADIGGHSYEFAKWGAEEALDALLDLSAIIGKPLGALASQMDLAAAMDKRLEVPTEALGSIVEALGSQLGEHKATAKALIKKLSTRQVLCDGKEIAFDMHYKARLPHLFDVVRAALEVQFGGFFGGALGALRVTPAAGRTSPQDSPRPTPTQSSGAQC